MSESKRAAGRPLAAQRVVRLTLPDGGWAARRGPVTWSDEKLATRGQPLSEPAARELFAGKVAPERAYHTLPGAPEGGWVPEFIQVILDHLEDAGDYLFCYNGAWEIKTGAHEQVAVGESLPELSDALDAAMSDGGTDGGG